MDRDERELSMGGRLARRGRRAGQVILTGLALVWEVLEAVLVAWWRWW